MKQKTTLLHKLRPLAPLAVGASLSVLTACGGGGGSSSTPTPEPQNRAPVINSVNLNASETFNGSSVNGTINASDADGDSLTFSVVDSNGNSVPISGSSFDFTCSEGLIGGTVTVSDGKASTSKDFDVTCNLNTQEVAEQLKATPVIFDSCQDPIVQQFDESVVCDLNNERLGIQYNSSVDTSSFTNVAQAGAAQGFIKLPKGTNLADMLSGVSLPLVKDNQVSATPGTPGVEITASADRDLAGNYSNVVIEGGFNLEGNGTENTTISCENGTYMLPQTSSSSTGTRSSTHSLDQAFVENVGQTTSISNCKATNANGLITNLEGTIAITINDAINNNPTLSNLSFTPYSINGVSGFEGDATISVDAVDPDANVGDDVTTVELRYRTAGSNDAWTQVPLTKQTGTHTWTASVPFGYINNSDSTDGDNLTDDGTIEYQIVANDNYGGVGTSSLETQLFFANEATADEIIQQEVDADPNKISVCYNCTGTINGNVVGPFDALLFSLGAGANTAYEYNGEGRTSQEMNDLKTSYEVGSNIFYEIPQGSISSIRTNIQNVDTAPYWVTQPSDLGGNEGDTIDLIEGNGVCVDPDGDSVTITASVSNPYTFPATGSVFTEQYTLSCTANGKTTSSDEKTLTSCTSGTTYSGPGSCTY
jgi:hypothetical protein